MNLRGWIDRARKSVEDLIGKIPLPGRGGEEANEEPEVDTAVEAELLEFELDEETEGSPETSATDPESGESGLIHSPGILGVKEKPSRSYVSISRVGAVRSRSPRPASPVSPVPLPRAEIQSVGGTPYIATSQLGSAAVRAPVPSSVRNMHRFGLTPLASKPAEFVISEFPGADSGEELDLGDDLFSFVARTINLKMRRSQVETLETAPDETPEESTKGAPPVDPPEEQKEEE